MEFRLVRIFLIALVPFLFHTGCVTPTGGEQPNVLTTEEEIKLGATMSAEIDKEETPLKNNAVQVYVRKIGERLADQSPRHWNSCHGQPITVGTPEWVAMRA